MRSTVFLFSLFGLVVPVVFAGTLAGGCAVDASLAENNPRTAPNAPDEPLDGVESSMTDGGAKAATFGSPLCGVHETACTPDYDGYDDRCTSAPPNPDGGVPAPAADAGTAGHACRIAAGGDGGVESSCFAADRRGVDGVECRSGADCAPGFDCVEGDNGSVCRHYCCSGSCEDRTSQNGGPTFCDIRKIVDGARLNDDPRKAPVCMPLKKCMLLAPGECAENETCAIVTSNGDTGCVPNGKAQLGQSCEYDQCKEAADGDLTCLGNPGNRRCYKLCRTGGSECGPDQVCTTGTIFQDTSYGVCKDPR